MSNERTGGDRDGDGAPKGGQPFEDRLAAARRKQGLEAPSLAPDQGAGLGTGSAGSPNPLGVGLRVGVEMVSALGVAVAIGWYLDKWLHTSPFLLMLFVLLGGAAGVANVWRLVGPKKPPRLD